METNEIIRYGGKKGFYTLRMMAQEERGLLKAAAEEKGNH